MPEARGNRDSIEDIRNRLEKAKSSFTGFMEFILGRQMTMSESLMVKYYELYGTLPRFIGEYDHPEFYNRTGRAPVYYIRDFDVTAPICSITLTPKKKALLVYYDEMINFEETTEVYETVVHMCDIVYNYNKRSYLQKVYYTIEDYISEIKEANLYHIPHIENQFDLSLPYKDTTYPWNFDNKEKERSNNALHQKSRRSHTGWSEMV